MRTVTSLDQIQQQTTPTPTSVRYLADSRELEISFGKYFKGRWSVEALQMMRIGENGWESLPTPTDAELADVMLWEGGDVVEFSAIDQHYSIAALLRGQLGSKQWMEKLSANSHNSQH